jgi:tRNA 2-thiouridine synthesizing protein A
MALASLTDADGRTAESLIRDLERLRGVPCAGCQAPLSPHAVLMSIALGFKDAPRCLPCLAEALDRDAATLRDSLAGYLRQRDCYWAAWQWANRDAGLPDNAPTSESDQRVLRTAGVVHPNGRETSNRPRATAAWDAGSTACGELVLELRLRLGALAPGAVFQLTARDPGAPEDLPAWCRLTGHALVWQDHPTYLIQRKI